MRYATCRFKPTILLLVLVATGAMSGRLSAVETVSDLPTNNQFAIDLHKQLVTADDGNLFYSPTSISIALAMTANGAEGETLSQMLETLHIGDLEAANARYAALLASWNANAKPYKLSVANRLWGQEGYALRDAFLRITRDDYAAPMELLDFAKAPETSRKLINRWVEKQTKDKIKDLLPQGTITPLTRLVLTNAIYFKGDWATQFDKQATQEADFTMADGTKTKVPLMFIEDRFALAQGNRCQAILLPYKSGDLSMAVVLPDEAHGLAALEKELSADMLDELVGAARMQKVRVFLPKFKLESSFGLNDVLKKMGMKDAFDLQTADFSGMTGDRDLYITAVVHKAYVDVDEKGTEAAAATGVVMGLRSMPRPSPIFRADHPFLFLIRDNRSGEILFMGRYVKP